MVNARKKRRERVRIWEPEWTKALIGWSVNYIKKNMWSIEQGVYEIDDLLQEGYLLFLKLRDYYPRVVEPAHFLSLYKTAFRNMFFDLTRVVRNKNRAVEQGMALLMTPCEMAEIPTELVLAEAPVELRLILSVYQDDALLKKLREPLRTNSRQPRESFNSRICKLIGLDPNEAKLVSVSKTWLKST
jgi:hypothetical protein